MSEINLEEQAFALNEKISFTESCVNAIAATARVELLFSDSVFLAAFEKDAQNSSAEMCLCVWRYHRLHSGW